MAEYIEREALLEHFRFRIPVTSEIGKAYKECVDLGRKIIEEAPTADVVEVRHGVWFWRDNKDKSYTLCCSVCHKTEGAREEATYCPNCGAIMDGKGEGE